MYTLLVHNYLDIYNRILCAVITVCKDYMLFQMKQYFVQNFRTQNSAIECKGNEIQRQQKLQNLRLV
jgi:hypothetical protein